MGFWNDRAPTVQLQASSFNLWSRSALAISMLVSRQCAFRSIAGLTLAIVCGWFMPTLTIAHHSFAMFDATKETTLQGIVKEFQWSNPHVWIQLLTDDKHGGTEEYGIECRSINMLLREGWKSGQIKAGDKISVTFHPLRDGSRGGALIKVVFPDGRELNGVPTEIPADDFKVK